MTFTTTGPAILRPYIREEAIGTDEAAQMAGKTPTTLRIWAEQFHIARKVAGRWAFSKVALSMHMEGDGDGLVAYLAGDRSSPAVTSYFARYDIPLPKQIF